jgi:hypothetical protein
LILIYSLLFDDFGPGREVVKGGKSAESLHEGERSLQGRDRACKFTLIYVKKDGGKFT